MLTRAIVAPLPGGAPGLPFLSPVSADALSAVESSRPIAEFYMNLALHQTRLRVAVIAWGCGLDTSSKARIAAACRAASDRNRTGSLQYRRAEAVAGAASDRHAVGHRRERRAGCAREQRQERSPYWPNDAWAVSRNADLPW